MTSSKTSPEFSKDLLKNYEITLSKMVPRYFKRRLLPKKSRLSYYNVYIYSEIVNRYAKVPVNERKPDMSGLTGLVYIFVRNHGKYIIRIREDKYKKPIVNKCCQDMWLVRLGFKVSWRIYDDERDKEIYLKKELEI